jgi:hypothetical protein
LNTGGSIVEGAYLESKGEPLIELKSGIGIFPQMTKFRDNFQS